AVLRDHGPQADLAVLPRADLVVLARGGDARPDDGRDQPAVPKPRAGPARSARRIRARSAAAAQQPPLGLRPGRAAPAAPRPAGVRVRPRVRDLALRPLGSPGALGGS